MYSTFLWEEVSLVIFSFLHHIIPLNLFFLPNINFTFCTITKNDHCGVYVCICECVCVCVCVGVCVCVAHRRCRCLWCEGWGGLFCLLLVFAKKTSHVTFFYQKLFLKNIIAGLCACAAIEYFFYSAHCDNIWNFWRLSCLCGTYLSSRKVDSYRI